MAEPRVILLVEDSDDDVFFLDRALSRVSLELQYRRARNGQEAIDYCLGVGQFSDRKQFPLPQLILVDLKMPICDGFDFLGWKREQPSLTYIPAIVLTSSAQDNDIRRCYELGAHSFTTKVADTVVFSHRISSLRDWWFGHCLLLPAR